MTNAAVTVLDEWHVVDRWWTPDPVTRDYADVRWPWGSRTVMVRHGGTGPWRVYRQLPPHKAPL